MAAMVMIFVLTEWILMIVLRISCGTAWLTDDNGARKLSSVASQMQQMSIFLLFQKLFLKNSFQKNQDHREERHHRLKLLTPAVASSDSLTEFNSPTTSHRLMIPTIIQPPSFNPTGCSWRSFRSSRVSLPPLHITCCVTSNPKSLRDTLKSDTVIFLKMFGLPHLFSHIKCESFTLLFRLMSCWQCGDRDDEKQPNDEAVFHGYNRFG